MSSLVLALSTERAIGMALVLIIVGGAIIYWLFNWWEGRDEVGAEVELAPNRKPYLDDDELETKKLDLSLTLGLATLMIIGVALPIYWLGEPGRQEGRVDKIESAFKSRGSQEYEELCSACHSAGGVGGVAPYTVTDSDGRFIASVNWAAPALNNVLYRYSADEVRWVLNFGRQNSPMPAWGAPGGGPLTAQQIDNLVFYLETIQISPEEVAEQVDSGVQTAARFKVLELNPELQEQFDTALVTPETDDDDEIDALITAEVEAYIAGATDAQLGELYFENPAAAGSYNCARCHTSGWSWNSDQVRQDPEQPYRSLIPPQIPGGGGFGPTLRDGATIRQFPDPADHADFIVRGSQTGVPYGLYGQGDGGGQMPAFGTCVGDRDEPESGAFAGFCELNDEGDLRGGLLTQQQIDYIVAYERSLGTEDEP